MPKDGTWLDCNGQSTSGYPELSSIVGSNVPNYQGIFLRGYGSQSFSQLNGYLNGITTTLYSSDNLGEIQGDSIRNIKGNIDFFKGVEQLTVNGVFSNSTIRNYGDSTHGGGYMNGVGGYLRFDSSTVVPTSNENRPINKAVRYLIKAK